jgi:hypothetical protein
MLSLVGFTGVLISGAVRRAAYAAAVRVGDTTTAMRWTFSAGIVKEFPVVHVSILAPRAPKNFASVTSRCDRPTSLLCTPIVIAALTLKRARMTAIPTMH